jgi:hypothetical protein
MTTAFRIFDKFKVFLDNNGTSVAGGSLSFYEAGTTTAKNVYGDSALSVNNGSTVALDSSGRPSVDVWGSGSYRCKLFDSSGAQLADVDDIEIPGAGGITIPSLVSGEVLTNDGANLLWELIRQVPDPTGQSGKYIGTDGTNITWQSGPAAPTVPTLPSEGITAASGKVVIGTQLFQWGTDTAPSSGTHTTNKAVSFPTAFSGTPVGFANMKTANGMSASGFMGTCTAYNESTTGMTVGFDINVDNTGSSFNITNSVPFTWLAIGPA